MTISIAHLPPPVAIGVNAAADNAPSGLAGMLKMVRNGVDTLSTIAPQLVTLMQGAALGCAVIGLGSSPLAASFAGAGRAFVIAGTVSGSMAILAKVYDYLADAVQKGASPLLEEITSFSRETLYPMLQTCLDKVSEMMNVGAGVVREYLAACISEHPIINYLLITFSMS
ncbi:hypothetical protein [Sodalis sp. RH23]|uniref:hypothetical protein n=1 Tax=unclassified Sodalis (in: enterobacteria) TaxID=2636512 RepID=UPI0039B671C1